MNTLRPCFERSLAIFRRKRAQRMHQLAQQKSGPVFSILFYTPGCGTVVRNDWNQFSMPIRSPSSIRRQHFESSLCRGSSRSLHVIRRSAAGDHYLTMGNAENMEFAIPWLIENEIPVTYFVTTE